MSSSFNVISFGEFTLHLRSGELTRAGRTVRLREQSLQILTLLLANPGEVVTRDEIRKRLWPNDTVVEFENSINSAVKYLRRALHEPAGKPRFIETLARRGYRFIGTVERAVSPGSSPVAGALSAEQSPIVIGDSPHHAENQHGEGDVRRTRLEPAPGTRVTHYLLIEKLGEGGMGVVYRAEDTRLGRCVAVKFLPRNVARHARFLEWFMREARTASSLNHANICTIHEVDQECGEPFIVMELLSGNTLKEHLAREGRPFPLEMVLTLGLQIADGLACAHAKGIVHRDIKPANIVITSGGQAKILDFGLAIPASAFQQVNGSDHSPQSSPPRGDRTDQRSTSRRGTPAYMSPEQATGGKLDASSDVYSLGAVLLEMMAPARGPDASPEQAAGEMLRHMTKADAAHKRDSVGWLQRIVSSALEPDPRIRYQSAAEVAGELRRLKADLEAREAAYAARAAAKFASRSRRGASAALACGMLAVLLLASTPFHESAYSGPRALRYRKLTQRQPDDTVSRPAGGPVCTDGSSIFYSSIFTGRPPRSRIFKLPASGGAPVELSTGIPAPFLEDISPDGTQLLVTDRPQGFSDAAGAPIFVLPNGGGTASRVSGVLAGCAAWSFDGGQIVYVNPSGVYIADKNGSHQRRLTPKPGGWWPRMSPDGKSVRFSADDALWEVSVAGDAQVHRAFPNLSAAHCCGTWSRDGRYYMFREDAGNTPSIWIAEEKTGYLHWRRSQPVQLTIAPLSFSAVTAGKDAKQLFVSGEVSDAILTRYDVKSGKFEPYLGGNSIVMLQTSPDRRWISYVKFPEMQLWIERPDGSGRRRLSPDGMPAFVPRWSPDGTRIAFTGQTAGTFKVYVVPVDSDNGPVPLHSDIKEQADPQWSPDGKSLMFSDPKGGIFLLDMLRGELSKLPGSEQFTYGKWSPDGRYVAAERVGAGVNALALFDMRRRKWRSFQDTEAAWEAWSHDSRYVYFNNAVEVQRLRISDGTIERVVKLDGQAGFAPAIAAYGNWMGLAPDDSPLLLSSTGTADIYAIDWDRP